jgi:hypothetical protein
MSARIEDSLKSLRSLPELEPPAELERSTLAAMAAAAASASRARPRNYSRAAAAAVVALGLGAWLAFRTTGIEPPSDDAASVQPDEMYFALAEQSMQLEEILALMPPSRRVMRAGTASTIVGLEESIAWIDAELYRAETSTAPPQYREALMRDRVEVMNALVNVRYAQSRAFIY